MAFFIIRHLRNLFDVDTSGAAVGDALTLDVDGVTWVPGAGGGGGGAPTNATYLVGAADATLTNEIVVGATPGGELGNTWASPTVDTVHSGSSHAATQAAAEATAAAALNTHVTDPTDAHDGSAISNIPAGTIAATDVQAALNELDGQIATSLADAVILAPASSARNVIQPTAGAVIAAIVKAHAAQSVDLTQWQTSDGTSRLAVTSIGELRQALAVLDGGVIPTGYDANSFVTDFSLTLDPVSPSNGGVANNAYSFLSRNAVDAKMYHNLTTLYAESIFRGTKAGLQTVEHTALYALAQTDTTSTGSLTRLRGLNAIASHNGSGTIDQLEGNYGFVSLNDFGGAPVISSYMAAFVGETYVETSPSAIPDKTVFLALGGVVLAGTVTRATGLDVQNQGGANIVTSYGVRVRAQSGATTSYGLVVEGGKSLFTDGLVIALIAAPADAAYANGEGGWWWDQANSLPKWKGKTSGGVVVNFTPVSETIFNDHSARHESGGADAIKLDDLAAPDDNTDLNASTTKHGLLPKLSNVATEYLSGTGAFSTPSGSGIPSTIVDAKGDLIAATAADTVARLAVGANDFVLTADSAQATGIKWAAAAGGGIAATIFDAKGDIIVATAADTAARKAAGANGTVLGADSAQADGLAWVLRQAATGYTTGMYIPSPDDELGTVTPTISELRAYPVVIMKTTTFDRITADQTGGNVVGDLRLGIYRDNGSGFPGDLVLDAGTVSLNVGTGLKNITISQQLEPGIYWLAAVVQGLSTVVRNMTEQPWKHIIQTALPNNYGVSVSECVTKAAVIGALPTPFASTTTAGANSSVAVYLRVA